MAADCHGGSFAADRVPRGADALSKEAISSIDSAVNEINNSLSRAVELYHAKKFEEFGKVIGEVEQSLEELKNGDHKDVLAPALAPLDRRLAAAHELLKASVLAATSGKKPGVTAKPSPRAVATKTMVAPKGPAKAAMPAGPAGMSFARDIGPLLQTKCGRCHSAAANPKGGFCIDDYAAIRRGSDSGQVFVPGKGDGSRLIELLETGDMPRGGGKLADADIAMIKGWIDAGAPFDGDPTAMASAGGSSMPTGKETVSFMRDIAPVIVGNCTRCHGGVQGADNLELETFAQIKRGGRDGDLLSAGNPAESLLVKMIRGTAKDKTGPRRRMPDRSPPLSEAIIKKFETWIAEGATFDGDDPGAQLEFLLRVITASKATHEELSKMRLDLAKKNWGLGNPGVTPVIIEEDDFRIVGDLAPARMQEVATLARSIQAKVASALKFKADKGPMYKGKLTVFLLNKRFEYSEFGQMVEKRELSGEMSGHFNYNVVDGYMAILASQENEANIPLLLAEGFAGSYIETLGRNIPRWYSVGSGRVTASRMEARSPLVKQWDDSIAGAMSSGIKLPQLLMAKQVDAAGSLVSYALVRSMVGRGGANQTLVDALRKGAPFNQAFVRAFGGTPDVVAANMLR